MFKNQIKFSLLSLIILGFMISSCSKESETDVQVENYGFTESYGMQKDLNAGVHGCVELVFPVTLQLPDGTELEVESFEDAKEQLQAWKEENPDVSGRPQVVFPVEVINQEGEVLSVASKDEIKQLIRDCRANFTPRPRHFRPCFKVVYPITIDFPDGTSAEANSRMELKQLAREWKAANPDSDERPSIAYPITIEYEDGTTTEINSKEELVAAKRACRER